jgi:rhamnosyltransferase
VTKIVANVVTYQPDLLQLNVAVERLLQQVDSVLIVNNSNYAVRLDTDRTVVINLGQNLGIARAQTLAMEASFAQGADFVLQMDQDSIPDPDMTQRLLDSYLWLQSQGINAGLIGPQDYDRVTGHIHSAKLHKGQPVAGTSLLEVSSTLSSGSLIPKSTFKLVGGMADDLFIDAVDHEYCWRIRMHGLPIFKDTSARLGHRLGDGQTQIWGLLSVGVPAPFRHYYAVRNVLLLLAKHYVPLSWKLTSLAKIGFKLLFYPFFLDQGTARFKFICKGLWHGVCRKTGPMT